MVLIHTSDIHLDSPLTSRLPSEKVRERKRELLSGFGRLVEEAKALKAKAIIISGDLFDSEKVSRKALDTAISIIEEAEDISFLYLQGNHEGNALVASGKLLPKNLLTFGEDWTYYTLGDLTVAGRSSVAEGMFNSLNLPEDGQNIVVLHGELRDRTAAPESIGLRDAAGKNIDYMALGHYHSHSAEAIDDRGVAVYCGTPEVIYIFSINYKRYKAVSSYRRPLTSRVFRGTFRGTKRRCFIPFYHIQGGPYAQNHKTADGRSGQER